MNDLGEITVFTCGPEPDDIFTAVYDAWASRLGHDRVALEIEGEGDPRLFARYCQVDRDREKAEKVARSVCRKISQEAYLGIYRAALSFESDRADAVYRFLVRGFQVGGGIIHRLQEPAVCRLFELSRKVGNESHYFLEFTRFTQWDNGVLLARIAPKCNVLSLVAPHFADRLNGETWLIYDENHCKAAVHPANSRWFLADTRELGWDEALREHADDRGWDDLWRIFVKNIAIEPRVNPKLQRSLMPLWYRKNMTEFQPEMQSRASRFPSENF